MLTFFLIIIFIIVLFITITYYKTKLEEEKSNIIFLSRHHSASAASNKNTNIRIEYFFPKSKYALAANNCDIHIAPLSDSSVVSKVSTNTSLAILDCAVINDEVWYEVEYPSLRRINNKGWIKNTDINISKLMMPK